MKLTNKLNLPQPIVKAVRNDSYDSGGCDISVTSLLKPPQLRALELQHADAITEDVSERIWSLVGQCIHGILERAEETAIAERRLFIEVNGWKIGGQMDRFVAKEGILQDYKVTSVYKVRDGVTEDFAKQLNIYAHILRANGEAVHKLEIVAILRDWSKNMARREENYPTNQIMVLEVPLIPDAEVLEFIKERVALHQAAAKGTFPVCTAEERWAKPDTYAVKKKDMARAVRVCNSQLAAKQVLGEKGAGYSIEFRPGESVRCESYCSVKSFCQQYKDLKEAK